MFFRNVMILVSNTKFSGFPVAPDRKIEQIRTKILRIIVHSVWLYLINIGEFHGENPSDLGGT